MPWPGWPRSRCFLVLGLLAVPELLTASGWRGLVLALVLALIARPVMVLLCLLPFRYRLAESGFISWVGLRGAVPILLATYPVLAGVAGASELFHLVFFRGGTQCADSGGHNPLGGKSVRRRTGRS